MIVLFIAIDQQAIVVPENIDAIRALCGVCSAEKSMKITEETLGMDKHVKVPELEVSQ